MTWPHKLMNHKILDNVAEKIAALGQETFEVVRELPSQRVLDLAHHCDEQIQEKKDSHAMAAHVVKTCCDMVLSERKLK